MTVTIDLTPELERRLRQAAAEAGVTIESFIIRSVEERLASSGRRHQSAQRLSPKELELLLKINEMFVSFPWGRYHELIPKRQNESLAPSELAELVALSDQIEAASAQRLALIAELARFRKMPMPTLMTEFGLGPHECAVPFDLPRPGTPKPVTVTPGERLPLLLDSAAEADS